MQREWSQYGQVSRWTLVEGDWLLVGRCWLGLATAAYTEPVL
jgi:hypothetical protein